MSAVRLATYLRRSPGLVAAIAFGVVTATIVHVAWVPSASTSGVIPWWTLLVATTHAIFGGAVGQRLVDGRTSNWLDACLTGGLASAAAVTVTAVLFSISVVIAGSSAISAGLLMASTLMVVFFAFVSVGWALVLVSAGVGWLLYRTSETFTN